MQFKKQTKVGKMPGYSKSSREKLFTCHPKLIRLFTEVVKHFDNTILEGHRGKERQEELFRAGKTKLKFPRSKHNTLPSEAVDAAPYPVKWPPPPPPPDATVEDWKKYHYETIKILARFYAFGGFVKGVASQLGIRIRWGGDWDGDWEFTDQHFDDLPHFELIED